MYRIIHHNVVNLTVDWAREILHYALSWLYNCHNGLILIGLSDKLVIRRGFVGKETLLYNYKPTVENCLTDICKKKYLCQILHYK